MIIRKNGANMLSRLQGKQGDRITIESQTLLFERNWNPTVGNNYGIEIYW